VGALDKATMKDYDALATLPEADDYMKYAAWFVLALLSPIIIIGFLIEAVREAFLLGRALFQMLREDE
jgi:hypothetical protein